MRLATAFFFSRCRNAISVSDVIVALAAGTPINSAVLPVDMLPAVVLLATVGLRTYEQQIVDDYVVLLDRMTDAFHDATLTNADYDHPHLNLVSFICWEGPAGEYNLDANPEAGYMFTVYEELVNAELCNLYKPVVETAQAGTQAKHRRTRKKTAA